ncbi:MAG TPA: PilZ domain-containing protein [Archangium sp.]|nr:PilZ domain-containing protein [Archangium sp.]
MSAQSRPAKQTVLVVDASGESQVHAVPPVLLSGCECVTATSVSAALDHLDRVRPLMTLVDARIFDTWPGEDPLGALRSHPTHRRTPLVLLADTATPTELFESAWRGNVADCLLRPVPLPQVQERVAALTAETVAPERRAARVVLVVDEDPDFRAALERILSLSGYRLLLAGSENEALVRASAFRGQVDAVVLRGSHGLSDSAELERLYDVASLSAARGLLLAPTGSVAPGALRAGVELMDLEQSTPRSVHERLERMLQRNWRDLGVSAAAPFFCPVQYRELGPQATWRSCYSQDVSPGGIFLRTLVPARVGSALELRIFLTTTGEVLEGSGVVSWANPWQPDSGLVATPGMGLQFLGMSPKRLGRLREICGAALF